MFPSSSIGNAPTMEPKTPVSTPTVVFWGFFFQNFIFFSKTVLRMTLMQSQDNKMSNFLLYIRTIFPPSALRKLKGA